MSFLDDHQELKEIVREYSLIREHNLKFKQGDPLDTYLLFAEASLVLLILERFVRIVVPNAQDNETVYNLLQRAGSQGILKVPFIGQEDGRRAITHVRSAFLHGNFEQLAKVEGYQTIKEFFKIRFASEVEVLHNIVDNLMKQIDPTTGKPYGKSI